MRSRFGRGGRKEEPRAWSPEEIISDAMSAKRAFQERREEQIRNELVELSGVRFPNNTEAVKRALSCVENCIQAEFDEDVCQKALLVLMPRKADAEMNIEALRYLAFPPISADDLRTTAEVPSLTKKAIGEKPEYAHRLISIIREAMDSVRFPWITNPEQFIVEETGEVDVDKVEKHRLFAIQSTALLIASQQAQTGRRSTEKDELESLIAEILEYEDYRLVPKKDITTSGELHSELSPGEFMKECNVMAENGDFVIRLFDDRFLFIECKASNSEINGRKRLNKEAVKNIKTWKSTLGDQIIGACAIRGVFKPEYVMDAQRDGVFIFWGHDIGQLQAFLRSVRVGVDS